MSRPTTRATRTAFARRNETLPCSAPHCHKTRLWTNRWCQLHGRRVYWHGHWSGRALTVKELRPHRRTMRQFLKQYADAPQVQAALKVTDALLQGHLTGLSSPASKHLRRLREGGLKPTEALTILGSVWFLSLAGTNTFPNDDSLTMALGLQLIRSRPHYREHYLSPSKGTTEVRSQRPEGVARREIGNVVRRRLGAFLSQAQRRLDGDREAREAASQLLASPIATQ